MRKLLFLGLIVWCSCKQSSGISVGEEVRRRRLAMGLNQTELAERLGISAENLGLIEDGFASPSPPVLLKIEQVLGLPAAAVQNK